MNQPVEEVNENNESKSRGYAVFRLSPSFVLYMQIKLSAR